MANKTTKEPFPRSKGVSNAIHNAGMSPQFGISLYPGTGTVDGIIGDHVLLAPAYAMRKEDMRLIASLTRDVVFATFKDLCAGCGDGICK